MPRGFGLLVPNALVFLRQLFFFPCGSKHGAGVGESSPVRKCARLKSISYPNISPSAMATDCSNPACQG